jgi:hypothetical protein
MLYYLFTIIAITTIFQLYIKSKIVNIFLLQLIPDSIVEIIVLNVIVLSVIALYPLLNWSPVKISNPNDKERIKGLVRQISRWSLASGQDKNVFIANLHANYGVGYLQALKDIYSQKEIEETSDINLLDFTKDIIDIQDTAARNLVDECPKISGKNKFLAELAGE